MDSADRESTEGKTRVRQSRSVILSALPDFLFHEAMVCCRFRCRILLVQLCCTFGARVLALLVQQSDTVGAAIWYCWCSYRILLVPGCFTLLVLLLKVHNPGESEVRNGLSPADSRLFLRVARDKNRIRSQSFFSSVIAAGALALSLVT